MYANVPIGIDISNKYEQADSFRVFLSVKHGVDSTSISLGDSLGEFVYNYKPVEKGEYTVRLIAIDWVNTAMHVIFRDDDYTKFTVE